MAGLLVSLAVMGVMMTVALPVWSQAAKREREAELVFRGEQYARAIELYQRQYVGAYPPDIRTLVEQRFLRKAYKDPMTEDGEFRVIYFSQVEDLQAEVEEADRPGDSAEVEREERRRPDPIRFGDGEEGGVVGVVSRSEEESLRVYNGRERYNEWTFLYVTTSAQPGATGTPGEPVPSRPGPGGQDDRGRFDLGAPSGQPRGANATTPRGGGRP